MIPFDWKSLKIMNAFAMEGVNKDSCSATTPEP